MKKIIISLIIILLFGCSPMQNHSEELLIEEMSNEENIYTSNTKISNSLFTKKEIIEDVNILILGDSIGKSSGSSCEANSWANQLANMIQNKYNKKVRLTNLSMSGNSSYAGYVKLNLLNDSVNYDLIILCFGQNDAEEEFRIYYEALIRAVLYNYPDSSIMCILESSQRDYTNKMKDIEYLANYYGLIIVDTIEPFQTNYNNLTNNDMVHPNDDGYKIYFKSIMSAIDNHTSSNSISKNHFYYPLSLNVEKLNNCEYISVEKLKQEGNSFYFNTSKQVDIIGIDYVLSPGNNKFTILLDDDKFIDYNFDFDYNIYQRQIFPVTSCNDSVQYNIQNEIKIVFEDKQDVNKFYGIILNYN